MFNFQSEDISEIMNVDNFIHYKSDTSNTLTRIKEYFLKISTNIFFIVMFNNIWLSFVLIYGCCLYLLITKMNLSLEH